MGDTIIGYVGVLFSIVSFGSNFIVTKKYDTGPDGFFFQLPFCLGIWFGGLICTLIRYLDEEGHDDTHRQIRFYPTAMLGGVIWETGNIMVVPIISRIGMALGLIIWGTAALLIGWFTGYFGLFGLDSEKDKIHTLWLSITGLGLATCSILIASQVKKTIREGDYPPAASSPIVGSSSPRKQFEHVTLQDSLLSRNVSISFGESRPSSLMSLHGDLPSDHEEEPLDLEPRLLGHARAAAENRRRHWEGIVLAIIAGLFFGSNFNPCTWIQDHDDSASQESLDYVFSHFCGILITSVVYFLLYCLYKKNEPWVNPALILPAFVSGAVWSVGQIGWFLANGHLGYTTAFPLVLVGPGFVASLWDVFVYREIQGRKNFLFLLVTFLFIIASALCTVLSRSD